MFTRPSQIDLRALMVAFTLLMTLPNSSFGAGLARVVEGNPVQPLELLALMNLTISVDIEDDEAVYTEHRYYDNFQMALFQNNGCGPYGPSEPRDYIFYRSLDSVETEVLSARIDGNNITTQRIAHEEADEIRRSLVHDLNDPAPLKDLGKEMLLMGPVTLTLPAYQPVHIELNISESLQSRGTLKGLKIPGEWHREPVNIMNASIEVSTEEKLRALYAPYDNLELTREGAHVITATVLSYQRRSDLGFDLLIASGDDTLQLDILPFRHDENEDGYFMAMLTLMSPECGQEDSEPVQIEEATLDFGCLKVDSVHSTEKLSLSSDKPTFVFGRFLEEETGSVILSGLRGGEELSYEFQATFPQYAPEDPAVAHLWATRHLGRLIAEAQEQQDEAILDDALAIAHRFGLESAFTHFVKDEDGGLFVDFIFEKSTILEASPYLDLQALLDAQVLNNQNNESIGHALDRVLPMNEGWFTDTSTGSDTGWIDIEFKSIQYFYLAHNMADMGIGDFLSLSPNLRFHFMGDSYRITDPSNCNFQADGCGVEFPSAPSTSPEELSESQDKNESAAVLAETEESNKLMAGIAEPEIIGLPHQSRVSVPQAHISEDTDTNPQTIIFDANHEPSYGCSAGGRSASSPIQGSGILLLLMAFVAHSARRRMRCEQAS